tara:strand:- start:1617 stop:2930 length:1314 start_codon:yes stop_codon:yes gene_type:complete
MSTLFIPNSINLHKIEEEFTPFNKYKRDKALIVIAAVNTMYPLSNGEFSEYTSVSSDDMRAKGVKDFPLYRKYLMKAGVIYTNGSYSYQKDDRYTRMYKITEKYRYSDCEYVKLTSKSLTKKLKAYEKVSMSQIKLQPFLWSTFKSITIDYEAAHKYAKESNAIKVIEWNKLTNEQKAHEDYKHKHPMYSLNHDIRTIEEINDKRFRFSLGKNSGRLNTQVTNMSKGLRKFLRINGMTLAEVDIKSSQPYLSILLFNEDWYLGNRDNKLGTNRKATFSNCTRHNDMINSDVRDYIETILDGEFYERLMKITGIKDRGEAKLAALTIMFSDNEQSWKHKRLFKKTFPTVVKRFEEIKTSHHRDFAILLQSMESFVMLTRVTNRIANEYPYIKLISIHDSFLCQPEYAKIVQMIMEEELTNFVGVEPITTINLLTNKTK